MGWDAFLLATQAALKAAAWSKLRLCHFLLAAAGLHNHVTSAPGLVM